MKVREDRLNEHFSQSEFKLDQGEALLKEMQQLRDELSQYEDEVSDRKIYISSDKCQASRLLKVVCQHQEFFEICQHRHKVQLESRLAHMPRCGLHIKLSMK